MSEFKKFIKHFKVLLIITGIVMAAFVIIYCRNTKRMNEYLEGNLFYESPNTERVYGDQRVFDYADQLTDSEEAKLEKYIHEAELKTCSDIVIVTLNQSLADYEPEYMSKYTMTITPDKYVMVYADKFWEDNKFGYNCPQVMDGKTDTGDGVLLVDNIFREPETNKIYTWMCTTGSVEERFSSSMIDYNLDRFYDKVEDDYYAACIDFIDTFVDYMEDKPADPPTLGGHYFCYLIGLIIFLTYFLKNRKEKAAVATVTNETYIVGHEPEFLENDDIFVRSHVSRVYDPPQSSSSGGGGGHHSSGGGGSHGGGGHSR